MRTLLFILALLASPVAAETADENKAFVCFAVSDIVFISDNINSNANIRPTVAEFWKEGGTITMTPDEGIAIVLNLSPEQIKLTLDQLLDGCDRQITTRPLRNKSPMYAFDSPEGLSCSKKRGELLLSDNPDKYGISINLVTGFDKKTPDQLTILLGIEHRTITLSPLQALLPLNDLLKACELKGDERQRRTTTPTG